MSSPYLKIGAICALFATAIGLTFYTLVPSETTNDDRYIGLSQSAVPPPPPPVPMSPPPPPPHFETIVEEEVYTVVEQMPIFPGCEELEEYKERKACGDRKMLNYVYNNVKYPKEAAEKGKEGIAVVSFKVSAEGKVYSERLVRDPGAGMGEAALRTVKRMIVDDIRWEPGRQSGKPVTVKYNLPVKFKLN